ncbi:hypothetical protein CPC08DRAFT_627960 [Agrocybe pediades]|nr:hypothetical protein CPC08DRAFT_627960 [Agrocybe pediades]
MNMRDLSKDDDFLSHLLVEKLGSSPEGSCPLLVHKMDQSRRFPRIEKHVIDDIVKRLVVSKGTLQQVVKQAVDDLLTLHPIRRYLSQYDQKQINAFATHASRYFELYHPSGCIEIAHTSRYSHHTGKSELCILATRNLAPGTVIAELKGSMANLTDEEDRELKRTDLRNRDIRRDFSVIHSKSMKKNHLFLGPARFVNHDCNNNCELFREGRYITFRVLRPIAIGEEITAHYGDGYFGKKNRHCLCETCEKNGKGGYSPDHQEDEVESSSDSSSGSDSDSDSDTSSSDTESDAPKPVLNVNERRTRRGVYAITKNDSSDSDNEDDEEDEKATSSNALDDHATGEIELVAELDTGSDLTSLAPSLPPSDAASPGKLPTPDLMTPSRLSPSSSTLTELTSSTARSTPKSATSTPVRSIISTRGQKARELLAKKAARSQSVESSSKRVTRSVSSLMLSEKNRKGKGKATPTPISTPKSGGTSRGSATDLMKGKKEEKDARSLRARPSAAAPEMVKEPPPKPEVPRGPDGKPLPTCSTCSNILPVIAVDSQVVWGLEKKDEKQDCPRFVYFSLLHLHPFAYLHGRCIRHFAIYSQPWPSRVPRRGGTTTVVEREESVPVEILTKKVTPKGLKVLDRKLAAAANLKGKKRSRAEEEEEEKERQRLAKRRKSMPESVVHKAKVVKTYSSNAKKAKRAPSPSPSPEPIEDETSKRRRGRPRLSLPEKLDKQLSVKLEEDATEMSNAVLSQPRSTNGRFGKKDKALKKLHSGAKSSQSNSASGSTERQYDSDRQAGARRFERVQDTVDVGADVDSMDVDERVASPLVQKRVLPRPVSGFRGGRLFSNPNPLQYALHAWKGPVVLDDSSSDDEKHPETPEDHDSIAVGIITDGEPVILTKAVPSMMPRAPLTFKPSPHALAKRNWNSAATIIAQHVGAEMLNIPETHSSDEDEEVR